MAWSDNDANDARSGSDDDAEEEGWLHQEEPEFIKSAALRTRAAKKRSRHESSSSSSSGEDDETARSKGKKRQRREEGSLAPSPSPPVQNRGQQLNMADRLWTHLGLQQGQSTIDYRNEVRQLPNRPNQNGYVVSRSDNRTIVNATTGPFDDIAVDSEFSYRDLALRQPDVPFLTVLSGLLGIEWVDLIHDESQEHLKRLTNTIQDILRHNAKQRTIDVSTRRSELASMNKQQSDLNTLRTAMQRINDVMKPTVNRWFFLASTTGYMPLPDASIVANLDAGTALIAQQVEPVPYWLVVKHILPQYLGAANAALSFDVRDDPLYWEPLNPRFRWVIDVLTTFRVTLLESPTIMARNKKHAILLMRTLYLLWRDLVLAPTLRLVPPFKSQAPAADAAKPPPAGLRGFVSGEDLARQAWFTAPGAATDGDDTGRYHSVTHYIRRIANTLRHTVSPREVFATAVTRADYARPPTFPATIDLEEAGVQHRQSIQTNLLDTTDEKPVLWDDAIGGTQDPSIAILIESVSNQWQQWLTDMGKTRFAAVDPDLIQNERPTATMDSLAMWASDMTQITDAMGVMPIASAAAWRSWFSRWIAATVVVPPPLGVAPFFDHPSMTKLRTALKDAGILAFHGIVVPAGGAQEEAEDDILSLLLQLDAFPDNARDTFFVNPDRQFSMELTVDPGLFTVTFRRNGGKIGTMALTLPLDEKATKGLDRSLWSRLTINTPAAIAASIVRPAAGVGRSELLQNVLVLQLFNAILWSQILVNAIARSHLFETLQGGLLNWPKRTMEDMTKALTSDGALVQTGKWEDSATIMELLSQFRAPAVHCYRELIRSTLQSPYDREHIHPELLIGAPGDIKRRGTLFAVSSADPPNDIYDGDVQLTASLTRKDSDNETCFAPDTWEKLFANLMQPPRGVINVYIREQWLTMLKDPNLNVKQGDDVFAVLWNRILQSPSYWSGGVANPPHGGVPDFRQLHVAFQGIVDETKNGPGAQAQQQRTLYDSIMGVLSGQWQKAIMDHVPRYAPPMALLQHMLLYVLIYFPRMSAFLLEEQRSIDRAILDTNAFLRAAVSNDPDYAFDEIGTMMRALYVPERDWHMRGIFTGRLQIVAWVTAACDLAYAEIQDLAAQSEALAQDHQFSVLETLLVPRHQRSGYVSSWPRSGFSPAIYYGYLLGVPLDVLTGFAHDTTSALPPPADRDFVSISDTRPHILGMLRAHMAYLVQQTVCRVRLQVPEQYKTIRQYEESRPNMATAQKRMAAYRFDSLGNRAWRVTRV